MSDFNKFLAKLILILLWCYPAFSETSIDIKDFENNKTKILFVGFESKNFTINNEAKQILNKILFNLKSTDLTDAIVQNNINHNQPDNNIAKDTDINLTPDFNKYYKSGIGVLILAQFTQDLIGNLEIRIRMWDILDRKQTFGKFYSSSRDNYNKTANIISDEIFKSISGEKLGHFNSQIVYVSESGSFRNRITKISTIDFDGQNYKNHTEGDELVLTPSFSKSINEIFYLRYFNNKPQIFSLNSKTGRIKKIGGFKVPTLAPDIHPKNSNRILLTAIEDGNSDIHELDLSKNFARKLTKIPAIDTTASYSPDGNSMAFISDRDGTQDIFIMNLDSLDLRKITNGNGIYSKPIFSPDGKALAFSKQKNNKFFIGILDLESKKEKLLTSAYLAEGARWSPSGRYLIYSKKKGVFGKDSIPKIYIIDIITGNEYKIPTPESEGATDPDWK